MNNKVYIKNLGDFTPETPKAATLFSAGCDIVATSEPLIFGSAYKIGQSLEDSLWSEIFYIEYETNLYLQPEEMKNYLSINPRSSISKYNLVLANSPGTGDGDYRGMYKCRFKYIYQPIDLQMMTNEFETNTIVSRVNFDKIYKRGDKIAQIMIHDGHGIEFEVVDELDEASSRRGGFGSTGV